MRPIGQMLNFGQLLDDSVQDYGNTTASPWFDWSDGIAAGPAVDVSVSLPMSFQPPEHAAISGPVPADPFAGVTSAVPMTVWPPAAQAAPGLAWPGDPFAGASSAIPMTVQPPAVPSLLAAPGPVQTSAPVVASPMSSAEIAPLDINTGMAGVSLVSSGVSASEPGTIITNSTSFSGGVATATDASDLNALIKAADSASSGTLTIDISGSLSLNTLPAVSNGESVNFVNGTITAITAVPDIAAINLKSGVSLVFNGSNNATLDGRDTVRGLFAYSGSVTVDNLTLQNMVALGGAGGAGSNAGGGGAGLGGGLFVGATRQGHTEQRHVFQRPGDGRGWRQQYGRRPVRQRGRRRRWSGWQRRCGLRSIHDGRRGRRKGPRSVAREPTTPLPPISTPTKRRTEARGSFTQPRPAEATANR
jgi:hypothetical protein